MQVVSNNFLQILSQLSLAQCLVRDSLGLVDFSRVTLCREGVRCLWESFEVRSVVLIGLHSG